MATTPNEIAFETAVESLAQQRASLADLRARAATILAAAAIATSFLGAAAIKDPIGKGDERGRQVLDGWEIVGVAGFCALALMVILILLPRKWSGWHTNARKLVRYYADGDNPATLDAMQRDLALHNEGHYQANLKSLQCLQWCFRICCLLLALQVVAWIIDLGVH